MLRRWRLRRAYHRALDAIADAFSAGDHAAAEAAAVEAVGLCDELYGAGHAERATPLYAVGSARLAQGRLDEARQACDEAVAIGTAHPGATEPRLPKLLELKAAVLDRQGRTGDVEQLFRLMIASYERMREPDPLALADAKNRLALLLARSDRRAEAAPLFLGALTLREGALPPEHRSLAELLHNLATYRPDGASLDEAAAAFERARDILQEAGGDDALLATVLHNLAALREEQGRGDDAASLYQRALELVEQAGGADATALRPTLVRLARVHHAARRFEEALSLYERALPLAERELGQDHPVITALYTWLGDARTGTWRN